MKAPEKQSKSSKPSEKAAAKPALKTKTAPTSGANAAMPKVVAKSVAKSVAKPLAKLDAKLEAKKLTKPAALKKPTASLAVETVSAKAALKAAVTAAVKPVSGKDLAAAKSVSSRPAVATEKTSGKIIQTPSQPVPKSPEKATKPAPAAKPSAAVKAAKPGIAPPAIKKPAPLTVAPASLPLRTTEKSMLIPVPPALKPGRRSSARTHSQMPPPAPMVPTHAPDAAKASYSTITERVIAPPPHVAAKKDPKLANNWKTTTAEALTDDEVKAMPDSEYMNEKQLAFFRHKLSVLKQEIHNSAGETTEHLREDTVVVPDPADRATIEEEHALELRTRDRERKLLKKIEQSIARIDSGDYGYCDETGEAIGVGRLIARPTANLSLEAQQRRELKQKMFGD